MPDKVELFIGGGSPDPKHLKPSIGGSSDQIIVNNKSALVIDAGIYPQSRAARRREAEKVFSVERDKPKLEYNTLPGGLVKVAVLKHLQATPDSDYAFPTSSHNFSEALPNLSALGGIEDITFFLTHAHADHVGAAPWAKKLSPRAKFLMTEETLEIAKWLWADYLKIMKMENRRRRKEGKPFVRPVFNEFDVEQLIRDVVIVRPSEPVKVGQFKITPYHAGHILGAVSVLVETLTDPPVRIFHTGDISFDEQYPVHGAPRLDYTVLGGRPDYLITESTYGGSDPTMAPDEAEGELAHDVAQCLENGGKVILPSLAIGRSQKNYAVLKRYGIVGRWADNFRIDGSSREISQIYKEYSGDPIMSDVGNYFVRDSEEDRRRGTSERYRILFSEDPAIVIVPSGMVHGGYAVRYASQWAENEKNLIALTCYQDPSLPGWHLLNTPRGSRVRFGDRKSVVLKATVKKYDVRGHASRSQLLEMIDRLDPRQTFLKHGEEESMDRLIAEAGTNTVSKTYLGDKYTL